MGVVLSQPGGDELRRVGALHVQFIASPTSSVLCTLRDHFPIVVDTSRQGLFLYSSPLNTRVCLRAVSCSLLLPLVEKYMYCKLQYIASRARTLNSSV